MTSIGSCLNKVCKTINNFSASALVDSGVEKIANLGLNKFEKLNNIDRTVKAQYTVKAFIADLSFAALSILTIKFIAFMILGILNPIPTAILFMVFGYLYLDMHASLKKDNDDPSYRIGPFWKLKPESLFS